MPVSLSVECSLCLDDDADGPFAALASCGAFNFFVKHLVFPDIHSQDTSIMQPASLMRSIIEAPRSKLVQSAAN